MPLWPKVEESNQPPCVGHINTCGPPLKVCSITLKQKDPNKLIGEFWDNLANSAMESGWEATDDLDAMMVVDDSRHEIYNNTGVFIDAAKRAHDEEHKR